MSRIRSYWYPERRTQNQQLQKLENETECSIDRFHKSTYFNNNKVNGQQFQLDAWFSKGKCQKHSCTYSTFFVAPKNSAQNVFNVRQCKQAIEFFTKIGSKATRGYYLKISVMN